MIDQFTPTPLLVASKKQAEIGVQIIQEHLQRTGTASTCDHAVDAVVIFNLHTLEFAAKDILGRAPTSPVEIAELAVLALEGEIERRTTKGLTSVIPNIVLTRLRDTTELLRVMVEDPERRPQILEVLTARGFFQDAKKKKGPQMPLL